jgi:hypothetical protein
MYLTGKYTKISSLEREKIFVPFLKILCTMVQLNQCTKAHVLKIVRGAAKKATRCTVHGFPAQIEHDVAAGRQSKSLAVRTVIDITDVQYKKRQK